MTNVEISYNPYKVETKIIVDGAAIEQNSKLTQCLNSRLQDWIDELPSLLKEECNDQEFNLTFHGTEPDYQDLIATVDNAREDGINIQTHKKPAKEFGEKEKDIKELFNRVKTLPFDELKSPELQNAFNQALNAILEVNVVATMSSGKSTVINALLGKKLMPSKNAACTATITKIKDNDDTTSTYKAKVIYKEGKPQSYENINLNTMKVLNDSKNVSEIQIEGNIPFVDTNEVALVLIDTPGPDNARDQSHKLVTQKALDESSKMLVLFVMDGQKLHTDSQDDFLKRIAKSMNIKGKQAKDRFLFVINKLDNYDEEDDDIKETIEKTINYLEEIGIKNPNVFPLSAQVALQIKRYQNTMNDDEKVKIYEKIIPIARNMNRDEQLHLEQYPHLPQCCQNMIDKELELAKKMEDILGQALIHSGIRGLEETIKMYVTKYSRPLKITTLRETLKASLDSAQAFVKTQEQIASNTDKLELYRKQITELNKKLSSGEENEKFKAKLNSLDIQSPLGRDLNELIAKVEAEFTSFFQNCPDEMQEDETKEQIKKFTELANNQQSKFQGEVLKMIECDIKSTSTQLLEEYKNRLNAISKEFCGDNLNINLGLYVQGELRRLEIDDDATIDSSLDEKIVTEKKLVTETRRKTGLDRLFDPFAWFDPTYQVRVLKDIKLKVVFVSRDKLAHELIPEIRKPLFKERDKVLAYAKSETDNIKKFFGKQFDKVDSILLEKTKQLHATTLSKEKAQETLKESQRLLQNLKEIEAKLNSILEI